VTRRPTEWENVVRVMVHTAIIPALRKLRQEYCEIRDQPGLFNKFRASLSHTARLFLKRGGGHRLGCNPIVECMLSMWEALG
jgi:hypothetical protein